MDAPALKTTDTVVADGQAKVTLRMFAAVRQEAGMGRAEVRAATVGQVLDDAARRYGPDWARVAARSRVWVNGEPAATSEVLRDGDEVAVLPPVSGGSV